MAQVANLFAPRYNTDLSGENFTTIDKDCYTKKDEMQSMYNMFFPHTY